MAIVRITDLVEGDEVYGYQRLGLGIVIVRRVDGYLYGQVPSKPQATKASDITSWQGTVLSNNVSENVLTCQITDVVNLLPQNRRSYLVDLHYSCLRRLRLLSKYSYEPRQENHTFPANFEDAAFKPYRTFTEVVIPSYVTGV